MILRKNDFAGVFLFEDDVYHNGAGISRSNLDKIRVSPKRYYYDNFIQPDLEKSDPLLIGNMVHTAVLEPAYLNDRFESDKDIIEEIEKTRPEIKNPVSTKEYKQRKEEVEEQGKYFLKDEVFQMAKTMVKSVFEHERLRHILKNGLAERCVYAIDPDTGILMRCKPDYMLMEDGINFDLKTTRDASELEFSKAIWNHRYFVQAAYYNYICTLACKKEFNTFLFGCLEKIPPYDIAVFYAMSEVIAHGEYVMREDLNKYAKCVDENIWPGYSRKIRPINMPKWAYYKED